MHKLYINIGENLTEGIFIKRLNRFVALVKVGTENYHAHLHDSGRLEELLVTGRPIILVPKKAPKTDFKIIAIHREPYGWIFLNSGLHRKIVEEILRQKLVPEFKDIVEFKPEHKIGSHRIDFILSFPTYKALMEVKGCTLFKENTCFFPDAPTKRGAEHLKILTKNTPAFILFLVCHPDIKTVEINCKKDPNFCKTFQEAVYKGVKPVAVKISFQNGSIFYAGKAEVKIPQ